MARTRFTSALPRLVEANVDHVALCRGDGDLIHPGFPLVSSEIRSDDLHPGARPVNDRLNTRVLETLVRKSRTTSPRRTRVFQRGSPLTSRRFPKRPIKRMGRRVVAVADQAAVAHEKVVEHQHLLAIGGREETRARAERTRMLL